MGTKGHNSSVVVDPNDGNAKDLESSIEHNTFLWLTADPEVAHIVCQAPPIEWVDHDGVVHKHTFDFLVTLHDGTRQAVFVKPADKVRRYNLEEFAAHLAAQIPETFADEVVLITNEDLPEWLVGNARLIHSVRLDKPCKLDDAIAERAEFLSEPTSVEELCRPFAPRGFRSVARLLYSGRLKQVAPGLIEPETLVAAAPRSN